MKFRVIVTLGPSLNTAEKLLQISKTADCIFRINGAHMLPEQIQGMVEYVRGPLPKAKIMMDLPGNKVRTANLSTPLRLVKGEEFELCDYQLNFSDFYKYVKPGQIIYANDSIYKLEVKKIEDKRIKLVSHSDGLLSSNKGFHAKGVNEHLPFFFPRDLGLIEAGIAAGVDILSLSFVRNAEDVLEAKRVLSESSAGHIEIFAKIETAAALENLDEIMALVRTINVDRGDLSADIGLHNLPKAQSRIIHAARSHGCAAFLATQFLKNMETYPVPLIAEIMDLHKTVAEGISGIQLSEETAVGKYPLECVQTVQKVVDMVSHQNRQDI